MEKQSTLITSIKIKSHLHSKRNTHFYNQNPLDNSKPYKTNNVLPVFSPVNLCASQQAHIALFLI